MVTHRNDWSSKNWHAISVKREHLNNPFAREQVIEINPKQCIVCNSFAGVLVNVVVQCPEPFIRI